MMVNKMIKEEQFGKDHWSLLLYVEYRAVNHKGVLEPLHLRIKNPALRPGWQDSYGTRLNGYYNEDGTSNNQLLLKDHDDLDCLDDLENAGLIEHFGSGLNPAAILSKRGFAVCSALNEHKQNGGSCSNFSVPIALAQQFNIQNNKRGE